MRTIGEVLKLSSDFLTDRKIDRARRIAEELLCHVLKTKKIDLYLQFDKPVIDEELALLRELLKRSAKNEPIEYITGEVAFFNCRIKVDRSVLIPRPETEILVDLISKKNPTGTLWDICTGSGCIGIALKKAHPTLSATLSDISPDALSLARENAILNHVEVELLQGDLLAPFKGRKADLIICNPPYISEAEMSALDSSVKDFEPHLALIAGERGTEFYERLALEFSSYLNPNGCLFLEIGSTQSGALKKLFPQGQLHLDWAGHPRFFEIKH